MEGEYDDSEDFVDDIPAANHTQFLDLTNGEGGERSNDEDDHLPSAPRRHVVAAGNGGRARVAGRKLDPNVPGRVVENGQEQTGRWTKEEHEAFLSALQMYGKEWKKVAAKVKTRTVVQTRTHAQKYFQKLAKVVESGKERVTTVDMGVSSIKATDAKRQAMAQKKRQRVNSATKAQRQSSVTSAAHLISNLSSGQDAAGSAAQGLSSFTAPRSSLPPSTFVRQNISPPPPVASSNNGLVKPSIMAPHGFSTYNPRSENSAFTSLGSSGAVSADFSTSAKAFPMKITAPGHDSATKRGKFPEPSPAACGKRKLAEIAAARMLAGVAAVGGKPLSSTTTEDGTATPPPEEEPKRKIPSPPKMEKSEPSSARKPMGLSLQIVNPESLGVSYAKERKSGQTSPQTPWEGDIEALMSEQKNKEVVKPTDLDMPMAPEVKLFDSISSPHPICGPGGSYDRNPLHKAVCEMDLAVVQVELMSRPRETFQRRDFLGFCPIHSACSLCMKNPQNSSIATDIVRALITAGADASVCDLEGNTPLHWAARSGDRGATELLLLKNCPKDAKNKRGETPMHWAMRAGRVGVPVISVLLNNGARPSVWNKEFKRPIDVAADGFFDEGPESVLELKKLVAQRKRLTKEQRRIMKDAAEQRKDAREHLLKVSVQSRTLVLNHPECLEHHPKSDSDWEAPGRITSIVDRLLGKDQKSAILDHEISVSQEFDRAKLDLLSRIHSTEYLRFVNDLSKDLERQQKEMDGEKVDSDENWIAKPPVVPFTPMVQRSMIKISEKSVKLGQHSDTSFSVGSLRAARRAAGAVQHAVDCVLIGRNRNAFCIVRPPGHHAGINGLLDGGESCGFCIFNSVAAGAMHAISDERLLCERCAIVDIDVHHGNGTEEIVRKYSDPSKLFFFSIHLFDNEEKKRKRESKAFQYKFYPGTGDEDDVALNIINVPITPMWKEKVNPVTATHNTRTRTRNKKYEEGDSSNEGTPKASDAETEGPRGTSSAPSTPTNPNGFSNGGRHAYRRAIQSRLLPALRAFNPDLILISAGFDACKGDVGNAKHEFGGKEKMGIDLEPEDYAWTTRKILEVADICCQGRVVSVLEGGYGRTPAPATGAPEVAEQPLDKSAFSECAMRHVHAMIDPYDAEARFKSSKNDI